MTYPNLQPFSYDPDMARRLCAFKFAFNMTEFNNYCKLFHLRIITAQSSQDEELYLDVELAKVSSYRRDRRHATKYWPEEYKPTEEQLEEQQKQLISKVFSKFNNNKIYIDHDACYLITFISRIYDVSLCEYPNIVKLCKQRVEYFDRMAENNHESDPDLRTFVRILQWLYFDQPLVLNDTSHYRHRSGINAIKELKNIIEDDMSIILKEITVIDDVRKRDAIEEHNDYMIGRQREIQAGILRENLIRIEEGRNDEIDF